MSFEAKCDATAEWIVETTGEELEDPSNLFVSLRSGAILCQLMNMLNPELCTDFDPFPETQDGQEENVAEYLTCCQEMGVRELFEVSDLVSDNGDVRKVLKNVEDFALVASEYGFAPLQLPEGDEEVAAEEQPPPPTAVTPPAASGPKSSSPRSAPRPAKAPSRAASRPKKYPTLPPGAKSAKKRASRKSSKRAPPKGSSKRGARPGPPTTTNAAPPKKEEPAPAAQEPAPAEEEETVQRPRGETEMLMNWQPPTVGGADAESLRIENTRLKAQAERADMQLETQKKLREETSVKLSKEREKVRALEEELDAEKKKRRDAGGSIRAAGKAEAKKAQDQLKAKEEEMQELDTRLQEAEQKAQDMEDKAVEMENAFNTLQVEADEQEEQAQKEIRQLEDDALYLTGELNRYKELAEGKSESGDELAASRAEVDRLKAEVKTLTERAAAEHKAAQEEMGALKSLQSLKGASDSEIARLNGTVEELRAEVAELQQALAAEKEGAAETQAKLEAQVAELEEQLAQKDKSPRVLDKALPSPRTNSGRDKMLPVPRTGSDRQLPSPRSNSTEKVLPSPRRKVSSSAPAKKPPAEPPAEEEDDDLDMQVPEMSSLIEEAPSARRTTVGRQANALQESLKDLFAGEYAEVDAQEFSVATNRQLLKDLIDEEVPGDQVVELKDAEFDNLIEIVQVTLDHIDPESPDDFDTAKSLIKLGAVMENQGVLLRQEIRDASYLSEPIFWDDFCVEKITEAFDSDPPEDEIPLVLADTLESYGLLMSSWNVSDNVILEVITRAAENEGLSLEEADEILANVLQEPPPPRALEADEDEDDGGGSDGEADAGGGEVLKSGPLKFKKGAKWIKAMFTLRDKTLSYDYTEEGIGNFGEDITLTGNHSAVAGSEQAPGALRNYSFKLVCATDKSSVLHLLAAKQPDVNDWIFSIMEVCQRMAPAGGSVMASAKPVGMKSVGKAAGMKRMGATAPSGAPRGGEDARKGSQPPVRIERSATQQMRLVKEGDAKMLVQKRWLRTHLELLDRSIVLTYIDPTNNTSQIREDIPLPSLLIAPNSPLAPAALKDSSWRLKDGEDEYHLMCNSKSEATGWLGIIKSTRDAAKAAK